MKGYFYLHNNAPVIATERKPEPYMDTETEDDYWQAAESYERVIKEWESQLIEPINWYYKRDKNYQGVYAIGIGLNYIKVDSGDAIEHEGGKITKIIQT